MGIDAGSRRVCKYREPTLKSVETQRASKWASIRCQNIRRTQTMIFFADVETTGVRVADRVVEVAWLLTGDDFDVKDRGHSLINPGMAIPAAASAVHGIVDRDVLDAPTLDQYFYDVLGNKLSSGDFIFTAHNCVTGDHEVLTPSGWVRFDELQDGVPVMQWDIQTGEASFTNADVLRAQYTGDVLEWDTTFHKGIYTPNHRIVKRGQMNGAPWRFISAEEFSTLGPNSSRIPVAGTYQPTRQIDMSPTQARALEMIRADGNVQKRAHTYSARFKFKRTEKVARCVSLLDSLGVPFSLSEKDGVVSIRTKSSPVIDKLCALLGAGRNKAYGNWVINLGVGARQALLDEIKHWDGHVAGGSKGNRQVVAYSSKKSDVDAIQKIAVLTGACSVVRYDIPNTSGFSREDGLIHRVTIRPRVEVKTLENPSRVSHDGPVFCVTVPTGAFFVRRKGVVWVTGNSPFDWRFIGGYLPESTPHLCTLKLARRLWPDVENHKLATLVYALDLDVAKDRFHSADGDMGALLALLQRAASEFDLNVRELTALANAPNPDQKMFFGKHKGVPLKDLPPNYVWWLLNKADNLDADLRAALQALQ